MRSLYIGSARERNAVRADRGTAPLVDRGSRDGCIDSLYHYRRRSDMRMRARSRRYPRTRGRAQSMHMRYTVTLQMAPGRLYTAVKLLLGCSPGLVALASTGSCNCPCTIRHHSFRLTDNITNI